MFLKLLIISLLVLIVSVAGLGLSILLRKNGMFPETHVSQNKEMQKRGLSCAQKTDTGCNPAHETAGCSSCNIR
jgi:predicted methyltransferase MtxX (methanogen marker protein 4)